MVMWHFSGKAEQGALGKAIDMDFSDDKQKMKLVLGNEPQFNFWHVKVVSPEEEAFIRPKIYLENEEMISIDDQKPFKSNNQNVLYTPKVYFDKFTELNNFIGFRKMCEENYSHCDGDCIDEICCKWGKVTEFKFNNEANAEVLVQFSLAIQVQNGNNGMVTFRMLINDNVVQQSQCSSAGQYTI